MTDLIDIRASAAISRIWRCSCGRASASALAWFALRELAAASRRFDDFVRELARFNDTFRRSLMDTLHTVLRSIRGETKARRDHLDVFREFLDHLDRASAPQDAAAHDQGRQGQG